MSALSHCSATDSVADACSGNAAADSSSEASASLGSGFCACLSCVAWISMAKAPSSSRHARKRRRRSSAFTTPQQQRKQAMHRGAGAVPPCPSASQSHPPAAVCRAAPAAGRRSLDRSPAPRATRRSARLCARADVLCMSAPAPPSAAATAARSGGVSARGQPSLHEWPAAASLRPRVDSSM
jgi:hypothetical protein